MRFLLVLLISLNIYALEFISNKENIFIGKPVWLDYKFEKDKIFNEINESYIENEVQLNNLFLRDLYINRIEDGRALVVFIKVVDRVTTVKDSKNDYTIKINFNVESFQTENQKEIQILEQDFKSDKEISYIIYILLAFILLSLYPLFKFWKKKKKIKEDERRMLNQTIELKDVILKAQKREDIEKVVHLVSSKKIFDHLNSYEKLKKYLSKIEYKKDWNEFEKNEVLNLMERYKNDIRK